MNLFHRNSSLVLVFMAVSISLLCLFTYNVMAGSIHLAWDPPMDGISVGYHVYRASISRGPYTRLTAKPITVTYYADDSTVVGQTNYYVVTSVDGNGRESAFSKEVNITVASYGLDASASVLTIKTASEVIADAGRLIVLSANGWNSEEEPMTYCWTQVPESTVRILGADRPEASFLAPLVVQDTILTFTIRVKTRNGSETVESVQVRVRPRFP